MTEEVLRGFLSDISIIWDVQCRNLHNPAMALNYRMQMMLELLSTYVSLHSWSSRSSKKPFVRKVTATDRERTCIMKYKLFRSPGDLDKSVLKHELVAVEIGSSIDEVTDALIRAVRDDLAEMPEYAHCETAAYAPEPVQEHRRVRRYQYEMMGIVYPQYAEKNILIDYGVIEEAE